MTGLGFGRWTALAAAFLMAAGLGAAPLDGEWVDFEQPDRSPSRLKVYGDEFYSRLEGGDGFSVVKDPDSGWFCYAELSPDGQDLLSTGLPYREPGIPVQPSTQAQGAHAGRSQRFPSIQRLELPVERRRAIARQNRERFKLQERADAAASGSPAPAPEDEPRPQALSGAVRGLTLLIQFPDLPGSIPQATVEAFCNQPGWNDWGNNGSVRDYWYDISGGALEYTNHVSAYYSAKNPRSYYTDASQPYGRRAKELIHEALQWLDAQGFNFSQLSTDSQGRIRAINAFYAGSRVNNWSEGLWPHQSFLSPSFSADGVRSGAYQITDMGSQLTLGTFCHENGHMIMGWPDLYDYDSDSRGVGVYDLMCNSGSTNPRPPAAWLRHDGGWASPVELYGAAPGTVFSVQANAVGMFRYRNPSNPAENFYIEAFRRTGRRSGLPDEGLAIWHSDRNGDNSFQEMTPSRHYEASLEQADGRFDLERNANSGDSSDLFHLGQATEFRDSSLPDAKWWDGSPSGLWITNISAVGDTMTFQIGGGSPSTPTPGLPTQTPTATRTFTPLPPSPSATASPTPWVHAVPGRIQAEDFNAAFDSTAGNAGGAYRSGNVDLEPCTDLGGGFNVGWIAAGEWLDYEVNVAAAGSYALGLRLSAHSLSGSSLHLELDGAVLTGSIPVPVTGGWQNWTTVALNISLPAGRHRLRVAMNTAGFNLNYLELAPAATPTSVPTTALPSSTPTWTASSTPTWTWSPTRIPDTPTQVPPSPSATPTWTWSSTRTSTWTSTPTATPSSTATPTWTWTATAVATPTSGIPALHAVPGRIQAENCNNAFDTTAGNTGGAYRAGNVDIEPCSDLGGGFNVGWTMDGEWMDYEINVASSGYYQMDLRVASLNTYPMAMHLELDGARLSGPISVPGSGGWQNWVTLRGRPYLPAGRHRLRVFIDLNGFNLNYIDVSPSPAPISSPSWHGPENKGGGSSLLPQGKAITAGPNPARDRAEVIFRIERPGAARLLAADLSGRLAFIRNLGRLEPGEHREGLDLRGQASGVLFLQLQVDEGAGWRKKAEFKLMIRR